MRRFANALAAGAAVGAAFLFAVLTERFGLNSLLAVFASSIALIVAVPSSNASRLRNVVAGHSIALGLSIVATTCLPSMEYSIPLAAATTIVIMLYFDVVHPPALGTPLIVASQSHSNQELGIVLIVGLVGLATLKMLLKIANGDLDLPWRSRRAIPSKEDGSSSYSEIPKSPVIRTVAMPSDTNPAGDIFGGWLMWQMDFAAGSVAARRARGRCATVAVEAMTFIRPVTVGDEISIFEKKTEVGRTSMKISIEAWRRSREDIKTEKVTEAIFTFVAIDKQRKPRAVPSDD